MTKNLKNYRLTDNSIQKIEKIRIENNLKDDTKAVEFIISNFDMTKGKHEPVKELQKVTLHL